ncbi:MAG TPA: ABC transporter ATP-binding protein [Acidimicrobiales bacterium]|jgi:ABC-type lipoprotein export system ATPase subunit|nr:ABC transporter ATP-binding protein [Acidimicrobiales bacterium]
MSPPAVRCERLVHVYATVDEEVTALRSIDLEVAAGETIALLGPSGSGKSTLLWILAGLTRPTAGTVELSGRPLQGLTAKETTNLRLKDVGVVLQTPARNLLPYESAVGNVVFAQRPLRRSGRAKRERAGSLLDAVGLTSVAHRRAGSLSGGEQQRLAIATALANAPGVLLADEPTSQLDHNSAAQVLELLRHTNREFGTTIVTVTHDAAVGAAMDRTITIRDGRIGAEGRAGEEYLVVGRDGTIQLPEAFLGTLPPGSLATAHRTPDGIELRPARIDQP